jgi:radical SAM superfamily enzyme YgiQ (UPF0313 family)
MRIFIAYPPLEGKGNPMLTQNRQFQWMSGPSYLYPCVPASAATLLVQEGHTVRWLDAIAERATWDRFEGVFKDFAPDLLVMETKTPVVRQHMAIADRLKKLRPATQIVLMGDHAAARPAEILEGSSVDWCLTGGDYDMSLQRLAAYLERGSALGTGVWFRKADGSLGDTGPYVHEGSLEDMPWTDRRLTRAELYFEKWKRRTPFLWTLAGRDCPWARCTFCAWTVLYPKFRVRRPEHVVDEIDFLIREHGAREIFDDTGALPGGAWLDQFCEEMTLRRMSEKILFGCNFRYDQLTPERCRAMKKAGFYKLLIGVESANQRTLDILRKRLTREQIVEGSKMATSAGLELQLTLMVGFPWETREDALETLRLARFLMVNGYAQHLQATVIMPYPGTPLFDLCQQNGWIRFEPDAYERYDMTEPVCKLTDMSEEEVVRMAGQFYKLFLHPRFVAHHLSRVRSAEDLDYLTRGVPAIWSHIRDFARIRR